MRKHTATRWRRTRSGYTLIEVLVTVTIMGLAAAIVVPNMLQGGTLGVQAGARMIIADIMFTQNEAMAQQGDRRILFDVADNSYRVEKYDNDTNTWTLEHNPVLGSSSGTANYVVDFDSDSRFRGVEIVSADFGGATELAFDDLGNPTSGGTVRLRFDAHVFDIDVAPFTGRVTVERVTN